MVDILLCKSFFARSLSIGCFRQETVDFGLSQDPRIFQHKLTKAVEVCNFELRKGSG